MAYLLVHGKLPSAAELAGYKAKLKALDNAAYNDLQPLVVAASTPGATIDAVAFAGAQDALTAFSNATKGN